MIDAHDCKGVFTLMALVGGCGGEGRPGRLPPTLAEGERGPLAEGESEAQAEAASAQHLLWRVTMDRVSSLLSRPRVHRGTGI